MLIFDIETNGLLYNVSTIHCLVIHDTETDQTMVFNDEGTADPVVRGVEFLEDADYVCAASSSSSSLSTETVARGVGSGLRVVVVWRRLLHRASAPLSSLLHRSPLSSSPSLSLSLIIGP